MKWITYAVIVGMGVMFVGFVYVLILMAAVLAVFFLLSLFPDFFGV